MSDRPDVPDGSGCAEIWEHLSEQRRRRYRDGDEDKSIAEAADD